MSYLGCTPRSEIEFGVALLHPQKCSWIPEGMLRRRESEQLELPWHRPVHEPVPIGSVAAVGPGLSLAPLDLCWPVTQMHRVAGAARLGECGSPMEGTEVERD